MTSRRPQLPDDVAQIARQVAAALEEAWKALADGQAAVLTALRQGRRSAQLPAAVADFKQAIQVFHRTVDNEARQFAERQLPQLYEEGAATAAVTLGSTFAWNVAHRDAVTQLTADSYADFLRRSQEAVRMSGAFYRAARAAGRREVPLLAAGNTTALQAAKALTDRLAATHPLGHVVYRNGARVPVRVWAEAATLAKSAVAYNAGTLNVAREHGVTYVEVFDGYDCGWTSHPDPDKATRTLRSVQDAADWPISHPRCTRGFGLRPDLAVQPGGEEPVEVHAAG